MRRQFSIEPKKEYTFVVGQSDNYLIMRDLSANITLESDAFKHMELTRSDTVIITEYQNVELRLVNHSSVTVTGEFQLSELDIRIREQRVGVEGSIIVDEISRPITVSEIQQPVTVVTDSPIVVERHRLRAVFCSAEYSITSEGGLSMALDWHGNNGVNVRDLLIQANIDNTVDLKICGADESGSSPTGGGFFTLPAGAVFSLAGVVNSRFLLKGNGAKFTVGYVREDVTTDMDNNEFVLIPLVEKCNDSN